MELKDALIVERYRSAVTRQIESARTARRAMAWYVVAIATVAVAASVLLASVDPLGLDRHTMPDLFGVLSWTVMLVALVAAVQIVVAVFAVRSGRRAQFDIDVEAPRGSRWWWSAEAIYLVIIVLSVVGAWLILSQLGAAASRAV